MDQGYIKPIFGRYRLPSLYRQFCGYYFLISDLKALKVFTSFNSAGTISQILGPKSDRLSYSLYTLRLLKVSVNIGGTILLLTLNTSVASIWRFEQTHLFPTVP